MFTRENIKHTYRTSIGRIWGSWLLDKAQRDELKSWDKNARKLNSNPKDRARHYHVLLSVDFSFSEPDNTGRGLREDFDEVQQ